MRIVKGLSKDIKILLFTGSIYVLILFLFNFWKYLTNQYNVLDLAIYNQVFWNLTHGNGLYSSIQQGYYFGDHAEFLIFLLAPIYAILPHPLTLLMLQTIGLTSTIFPIYFLCQFILSYPSLASKNNALSQIISGLRRVRTILTSSGGGMCEKNLSQAPQHSLSPLTSGENAEPGTKLGFFRWEKERAVFRTYPAPAALLISLFWLINPIVWNINFFEFHILPFALPLLLWAIYFLLTSRLKLYWLFLFLSLLVREDVALIIFTLGLIIIFPRFHGPNHGTVSKTIGLITMIVSASWFFGATKFIQYFSTDESYKYLSYYSWLGNSLPEIMRNALLHPLMIINHIASLPNFEMILGFLMVFLFLPLLRPKFLLLALIPLLQFILSGSGGSVLILQIHYAALFLPGLIVAHILGFKSLLQKLPSYISILVLVTIVTFANVYNFIVLGPVMPAIRNILLDVRTRDWQNENQIFSLIPTNASVAATYMPLAKLSSRQNLHALHYLYVGKKQFSGHDYKISNPPDYIVIDEQELGTFKVQYESLAWSAVTAKDGFKRLEDLITSGNYGAIKRTKNLVLLQKNIGHSSNFYKLPTVPPDLRGFILLNDIRSGETHFTN